MVESLSAREAIERHRQTTLRNWDAPGPTMDYSFLHMPEFFTHAIIHRSGPISMLAEDLQAEVARHPVDTDLGEMALDDYAAAGPVNGAIVVHQGRIVYERYPRMRDFDKHLTMSVSKVFTSAVVALLEERGQVDTLQPVERYIKELRGSGWEGVSVRDILDMASGIAALQSDIENPYTDPTAPYYQFEASLGWLAETAETMDSTYDFVASMERYRSPGEAFEYTSVNTFVLSWLCERVIGLPFNEILTAEIWSKLGAESDALITTSKVNAQASHGGISATLRDIARFGLLYTPSWEAVALERVVSDAHLQKIQQDGRPEIFDRAAAGQGTITKLRGERPRHNSYQWDWVMDDGDFYKGGYGGQGLYISPTRDLVIAFFGTATHAGQTNDMPYIARQLAKSGMYDIT